MQRRARSVVLAGILTIGGSIVGLGLAAGGAGATTVPTPPATVAATNWTVSTVASPSTSQDYQLFATACATGSFCVAVGDDDSGHVLIEQWNGSSWSIVPGANPGSTDNELYGVSCAGPIFCLAVGISDQVPLVEQWNGTTWTNLTIPNPSGSDFTSLQGVSCLSATWCQASGFYTSGGHRLPLAEVWNGTSWTMSGPPIGTAFGATDGRFNGISCVTSSWCAAVGQQTVGADNQPLIETWNGTTWSLQAAPIPSPGTNANFNGVSCAGANYCVAVGNYIDSATFFRNLVAVWNGASWAQATVPDGPASIDDLLLAVSCFSATSCSAVGREGITSPSVPQSLSWNGVAWSMPTTPSAPGSTANDLEGVACLTNWKCVAVGDATLASTFSQPFALMAPIARSGYRFAASDGGVFNYGPGAPSIGSLGGTALNAPVVGMGVMPAGDGYALAASDGGVFTFGSSVFWGSAGNIHLNKPVVGMAMTADGAGYYLVASDGGIFTYGDANFYGSTGNLVLNKPIVGMAITPDGKGYWLVASDGGVFSFGDATFMGSTGNIVLNKPMVGMAAPVSGGYYLVATDGGIFSFPTGASGPPFLGSTGALTLNKPIVGMTTTAGGYYLSGSDGGVFSFPGNGVPTFYGSTGNIVLNKPIVGMVG